MAKCNFCAFYRDVGSPDGYVLGFDELFRKIDETIAVGGVQLLLQGGHNPDLPLTWYEDLFRAVKERYPTFKLHALSPPEVIHLSRLSQLPVPVVIDRLIAAGLDSIPGGGAEILVDRVRKLLHCYGKATADEWLDVMRHAHRAGLRTTATMMYGTVETDEERLEHLLRLRDLQDETGGFTAFITWSYQPDHTELAGTEATGVDYLRTLAIARIVLDNFDNLQASWVTQGGKVGQLSLAYGANDMGSVMIEENVVRAAGASYCMDEARDRAQHRGRRLRRQAPQHALRDPRRSDLPRARRAADARARHRARGRRHARARGAALLSARGAAPGSRTAAMRSCNPQLIRYHAAWILPISEPPIRDGWVAVDRGRVVALGAAAQPRRDGARERRSRRRRGACPAWSTRTPTSSCRICATRSPPASEFVTWIRGVMAARRQRPDPSAPEILDGGRRGHRRGGRAAGPPSSATSATRSSRSRRSRAARWRPSCSTS